jgi:exonuclease SbcD
VVNTQKDSLRGNTALQEPKRFKTITIEADSVSDPQQKILATIDQHDIEGCVVRIVYCVKPEQLNLINEYRIREKLSKTAFCSITPVVIQKPCKDSLSAIDATYYRSPVKALEKYLDQRPELNKQSLMAKAKLLAEELV